MPVFVDKHCVSVCVGMCLCECVCRRVLAQSPWLCTYLPVRGHTRVDVCSRVNTCNSSTQ